MNVQDLMSNVYYLLAVVTGGLGLIFIIMGIVAYFKHSTNRQSKRIGETPINTIGPFVLPSVGDTRWEGNIKDGVYSYWLSSIYFYFNESGRAMVFVDGLLLHEMFSSTGRIEEARRRLDSYAKAVKASYETRSGAYVVESTVAKIQATLESINSQGSSSVVGRGEPS